MSIYVGFAIIRITIQIWINVSSAMHPNSHDIRFVFIGQFEKQIVKRLYERRMKNEVEQDLIWKFGFSQ